MLKITGCAAVLSGFTYIGFWWAAGLSKRGRILRELCGALKLVEFNIEFLRDTLLEVFEKVSAETRGEVGGLFAGAAEGIRLREPAAAAWERAVEARRVRLGLYPCDASALLAFGKQLGAGDVESQVNNVKITVMKLSSLAEEAEEKYRTSGKLCRGAGLLAGIAIVILFI